MIFPPWKEKQKQKKQLLWGTFFLFCFSFVGSVWAVDADGDGLQSENDNTDLIDIFTPHVTSPTERQAAIDENLLVPFSGDGEVDTQIRVFEGGDSLCATDVVGTGISIGTASDTSIDGESFTSVASTAQFFYDTGTDSASTAWRSNEENSWHEGTDFPSKSIIAGTANSFRIYDAEARSTWKTFAESNVTSLFALNGKVYIGKSTGLKIYDFVNDDFTTVLTTESTPAVEDDSVTSLDGETISAKDYIVVGTGAGVSIYNATDDTVVSKATAAVIDVTVDTDNKLRYGLSATSFVSDDTVDALEAAWDVTDISTGANFGSGTGQATGGDFIGHSSGVAYAPSLRTDIENGLVYKETFDSVAGVEANPYENATVTNATIVSGRDATDSAMDFDGSTSYIDMGSVSEINALNSGSIGFWVKTTDDTEDVDGVVFSVNNESVNTNFSIWLGLGSTGYLDNELIMIDTNDGGTNNRIAYQTEDRDELFDGTWHHIVVQSDGSQYLLYLDGELKSLDVGNGANDGQFPADLVGLDSTLIGGYNANSGILRYFFDGQISDLKIYNRTLTSTEITNLAADGAPTYSYRQITKDAATPGFTGDEVGYWPDSVTDRSDAGNNLTNNNSVTISEVASGSELQQFTFNGTSNYLSSDSADFNITGDELTVGMWIKRADTGGTGAYSKILSHGESADSRSYSLSAGDEFFDYPLAFDPYFFGVQTANGFKAASVQTTPATDTWEFIVGTYDGSNVRIYRNGILEEVNPHTGNLVSVAEDLRIGWGYGDEYFDGNIALPFVSANALTTEEILSYYNLTSNWFSANATFSLFGSSNSVTDISQHPLRNTAYISTADGVTKLDTSTGLTTQIVSSTNVSNMAVTHIGTWTCSATMTQGTHTIFARAYIGANPSTVASGNRIFYSFQESDGDTDGDGLLNDNDNNPGVPITTPVISTLTNTSGTTYTITGTGDATTMPTIQTRVAILEVGNDTPLFYADVDADGDWSEEYEFSLGSYTLYAKAYVGVNASNVTSEQVLLDVSSGLVTVPTMNALPTYTGTNNRTVSWSSDAQNVQFYAQVATDEDFSTGVQSSGWISNTSYNFQNLSHGATYYFRVKLRSADGTETDYSDVVSTTVDLQVPSVGSVANDSGSYSSETALSFSWTNFVDSGSGVNHYEVQISTSPDFSSTVFSDNHYMGTQKTYTGVSGNTYFARVRAVDHVGKKSAFVYSSGTTIDTSAPVAFSLHEKSDPAPVGDQIISWDTSSDGESGIQYYDVQREDYASDGSTHVVETAFRSIGTTTGLSFTDTTTEVDKWYFYKVTAVNNADLETVSTNTIDFFVREGEAHPPILENVSHYASTDSVTIDWASATDVAPVVSYKVFRDDELIATINDPATTVYIDTEAKSDGRVYRYKVQAFDTDGTGGGFSGTLSVLVDKTDPVTAYTVSGTANGNGWYANPVMVTLTGSDGGDRLFDPNTSQGIGFYAGVEQILYNKNSAGLTPYSSQISFGTNGTNTLSLSATDKAGNEEAEQSIQIKVDGEYPTASLSTNLDLATNNGFVSAGSVNFEAHGTDQVSGIASVTTYVRFDQNGDGAFSGANDFDYTQISTSATPPDSDTYTFVRDGRYDLKVVSVDNAGNSTTSSIVTIVVDRTAPTTINNAPSSAPASLPFTITLSPSDAPVSSGIAQTYYTTDGTTPTTSSSTGTSISSGDITFDGDYFTVKYFSVDNLGNTETIKVATNNPTDTDGDGMPDDFESAYTDPSSTTSLAPGADADSDSLTNLQEYQNKTDPTNADSDGDSIGDGTEVSDGTDPNESNDHRIIVIAPDTADQTTDTPFTFLAKAPVGKVISLKNSGGTVIATATSDASGRAFVELSLAVGADYTLSAEFLHEDGQLVQTTGISADIASGDDQNPKFTNVEDGQLLLQGFIDLEVSGKANATLELFEITDGNISSLAQENSDANGDVTFTLPNSFISGQLLVLDHTNLLTSEIVSLSRGVQVTGQVLSTDSIPLEGISVKFINGGTEYSAITDTDGSYTFNIPRDITYLIKIYSKYYEKYEVSRFISDTDPRISPALTLITDPNLTVTSEGSQYTGTSGKAGTIREAGLSRYEILQNAELGYEHAVEQAKELNKGKEGEILTRVNEFGQEQFIGYQPGRLSVDEFKVQPQVARRVTGLLVAERREAENEEGFLTAARKDAICVTQTDTVAAFSDVPSKHRFGEAIMKINSYGVLTADEKNHFRPEETISWLEVLQSTLAANCIPIESFIVLQRDNLPELQGIPLENTIEGVTFYTALKQGIVNDQFDGTGIPTRKDVFPLLARAFGLEINEKATNASYADVLETDPLAPVLVSAKLAGWLVDFPEERFFYHNKPVTRAEFSSLFVNALVHKEESITQGSFFQKLMEKLRGTEEEKKARLGTRETSVSDVETHLRGRRYYEEEKEERIYYPTRNSWNPLDPNTERDPIKMDHTGEIRRSEKPGILRDIEKAEKILNEAK